MKGLFFSGFALLFTAFVMADSAAAQQTSEDRGNQESFSLGLAYRGELFGNIAGGSDTGLRYLDNIDVDIAVDLESLAGLPNSTFFVYGLGNQGGSISELVGDVQGVSNIEAENSWRLYEAWFEKVFPAAQTSVLLGLYDLNSEFDVIRTGALFINSSHGIGAAFGNSGVLGPSIFPFTSLGARLKINPTPGLTFKAVVLDGIPSDPGDTRGTNVFLRENDGALIAAEVGYASGLTNLDPSDRHTFLARGVESVDKFRFAVGGWIYTRPRPGFIEDEQRDRGVYALAESKLYSAANDTNRGLAGFVRVGLANGKINRFSGYTGAGLVYTGLFDARDEDRLGLALALPISSSDFEAFTESRGGEPAGSEANIEATYLFMLSKSVQFQLDVQYVINPNTLQNIDNAVVIGTRLILSL